MNINQLKAKRSAVINESRVIVDRAKAEDRDLTAAEHETVNAKLAEVDDLTAKVEAAEGKGDPFAGFTREGKMQRFDAKAGMAGMARDMLDGYKSLAASGSVVAPAGLITTEIITAERPINSLLAAVPTQTMPNPPKGSYLRQNVRTNNAAVVTAGDTKPVSPLGIQRIDFELEVVAHRSEPINKYWLNDLSTLAGFVQDEMALGLNNAVEGIIVNGTANNTGLLNTSGIQTQAFDTDGIRTVRKAITKVQVFDGVNPILAINPVDWEAINLIKTTTGEYVVGDTDTDNGTPTGAAALRSWGVPVVLSTALPVNTAALFDPAAVTLYTDGSIEMMWNPWTGFATNEVEARCEGRFAPAVSKPARVVKVALA